MKHLLCLYLKCGSRPVISVEGDFAEAKATLDNAIRGNFEPCHVTSIVSDDNGLDFSVRTDQIVGYSIQPAQELS